MLCDNEFVQFILDRRETLGLPGQAPIKTRVENLSGNINRVRRITLTFQQARSFSFIVKHLPEGGCLERYPAITFPTSRLKYEVLWNRICHERVHGCEVRPPHLLAVDDEFHTLIFEDFGRLPSIGALLRSTHEVRVLVRKLGKFLGTFHGFTSDLRDVKNPAASQNRPFVLTLPLEKPELVRELWQGQTGNERCDQRQYDLVSVQTWFLDEQTDRLLPILRELETSFRESFLTVLTHGDLHGESILVVPDGWLAVLDAELCDSGSPSFDTGTLLAHIICAQKSCPTGNPHSLVENVSEFLRSYEECIGGFLELNSDERKSLRAECFRYAGAEIVRRVIGAATLPYLVSVGNLKELLSLGADLIYTGENRISDACKVV